MTAMFVHAVVHAAWCMVFHLLHVGVTSGTETCKALGYHVLYPCQIIGKFSISLRASAVSFAAFLSEGYVLKLTVRSTGSCHAPTRFAAMQSNLKIGARESLL